MAETATYKIDQSGFTRGSYCAAPCGHSLEAHGSRGMVCAACPCKKFVEQVPAVTGEVIK